GQIAHFQGSIFLRRLLQLSPPRNRSVNRITGKKRFSSSSCSTTVSIPSHGLRMTRSPTTSRTPVSLRSGSLTILPSSHSEKSALLGFIPRVFSVFTGNQHSKESRMDEPAPK